MVVLGCQHEYASYSFKGLDPLPPSLCFEKHNASLPLMSPQDISREITYLKPWSHGREGSVELSLIMSVQALCSMLVWWNSTYCEVRSWLGAGMTSC
jgi:hypothetical protein